MLFREPLSPALVTDVRDGVVTLGRLASRVALRVQPDVANPSRWWLRVAEVLPPSISLSLVFSDRARSIEGRSLTEDGDGGVRATGVALQVRDASSGGPILTPALLDAPVGADAALLWLRCDRPVRVLRTDGVTLLGDDNSTIATRVEADERTPEGVTRVLRVLPLRALRVGVTYSWRVEGLISRRAIAAEPVPWRLTVTSPPTGFNCVGPDIPSAVRRRQSSSSSAAS